MKKVLLATTMLVAGASIAAAEVTLSGDARMGLISNFGDDNDATNGDEGAVGFTSRARVTFTMAGESDSGLSFGASFRADNADDAATGIAGTVFISGAFGKLSMGDTDGAAAAAVGHVNAISLTGLSDVHESLYLANGGFGAGAVFEDAALGLTGASSVLYEYTAGALSLYVSATQPNYVLKVAATTGLPPSVGAGDFVEGDSYAIGAKYSMDAYTVSLGYETMEFGVIGDPVLVDLDHLILGASGTFAGVTVKGIYGKADGVVDGDAADLRQYSVSASYTMDAISGAVYTNNRELKLAGVTVVDQQAIGLGVSYDLGGGASVKAGYARVKDKLDNTSDKAFDLGVAFTF